MLRSKNTTILSELNGFFTSSQKAIETIFNLTHSLKLTDSQLFIREKPNSVYKNPDKLLLMLLFTLFNVKSGYDYKSSALYPILSDQNIPSELLLSIARFRFFWFNKCKAILGLF